MTTVLISDLCHVIEKIGREVTPKCHNHVFPACLAQGPPCQTSETKLDKSFLFVSSLHGNHDLYLCQDEGTWGWESSRNFTNLVPVSPLRFVLFQGFSLHSFLHEDIYFKWVNDRCKFLFSKQMLLISSIDGKLSIFCKSFQ